MDGRLEILRYIPVRQPAYAAALSMDGQYIIGGLETGIAIFDKIGRRFPTHPSPQIPVHQVAVDASLDCLFLGTRQGHLLRLDLVREEASFQTQLHLLYQADNDLHSLALSADGRFIALGHFSPGLAVLQSDGRLLWRRHPEEGTATEGRVWKVALSDEGDTLYVGSAGTGINRLAALDARQGEVRTDRYVEEGRVTGLAPLPENVGVVAVVAPDPYTGHLLAYSPDLEVLLWERFLEEPITALATDRQRPVLAVGVGFEGRLLLLDTRDGQVLAANLSFQSVVNALAIVQGRFLAAATQDGNLVFVRYFPKEFHL